MSQSKNKTGKKLRGVFRVIRRIVKWIIVLAILLAAGLFGLKAYIQSRAQDEAQETYSSAPVVRGAMEETVYGTGTTSALSQPSILAEADGTLTELHVSIGDEVKKGDILAVITNEEIDATITDLEFALWELDAEILDTKSGSKVLSIEAPVAGRVMALYADVGDDALAVFRREGALALISTDGRMKVALTNENASMNVSLGDRVKVVGETVDTEGTITDLTHQNTHATVTIIGDEWPMGEVVTISNMIGEKLGEGVLEVNKPMAVSSYGGTISKVNVKVGDTVKREAVLYKLQDSPLTLTIESLRLQRETAAKELETAKAQRESLIVVAPCDGVVAALNVAEGDAITSGTLLGSILEGEDMSLTIAVDELDVVEVKPGQQVAITVDAFGDMEFSGTVQKIAPVGTNSGGVTTYDVQLAFEAAGTGVRSGMNATGEIRVASVESTLYVPVEALMTIGNETYVMVADGGTQLLTDSAAASSQRGQRAAGETRNMGSMPDMSNMPNMGDRPDMSNMPDRSGARTQNAAAQQGATEEQSFFERIVSGVRGVYAGVMAWLYEGIETDATQVAGTLYKVEVGMQNDEYAEILSGVSEGDIVLYTGSEEESSSMFSSDRNNRGGSMGGMNMMRMGF